MGDLSYKLNLPEDPEKGTQVVEIGISFDGNEYKLDPTQDELKWGAVKSGELRDVLNQVPTSVITNSEGLTMSPYYIDHNGEKFSGEEVEVTFAES